MEIGIDSFVPAEENPGGPSAISNADRVRELLEQIKLADEVGLDVFAIGEHHRPEYIASSPATLLAAAAAITKRIRLASAVTVLSSDDPVRVFQQFATVDLISNGRAEIIVGRGSFIESYPLFGFDLDHYDELFAEKLDLLLKIRESTHVTWSGKHRAPLTGQGVYPRPVQNPLPVHIGVGGTPQSVIRAAKLGLPLVLAIIGGQPGAFRPLLDLYRETYQRAGYPAEKRSIAIHSHGYIADSSETAVEEYYPAYAAAFNKIGKERGWSPVSRPQFGAARSMAGALLVGDPETVAEKIIHENQMLGGIDRITLLLGGAGLPHRQMMRAIELLGTRVAPIVKRELAAKSNMGL